MKLLDIFKRKKKSIPAQRNYAAANVGRLFADFVGSERSADSEMYAAITRIRNRARDLERNNEYTRRFLTLMETNVVGERGFTVQLKATNVDGTMDRGGNDILEREWKNWSRRCTTDGQFSFLDVQRMCVRQWARDGEVFIRKVKNSSFRDGFALSFIEPERIDIEKSEFLKNGNQIRMGVEIDAFKRPVAYWVLTYHPGDYDFTNTIRAKKHERIPADQIVHLFKPTRAGQTRGESPMAPAINALKMLDGYRESEIVAARTAASKMGFFTSPAGDGFNPDDIQNDMLIMDAEPGTFHQLPNGVDFKTFDPDHPTSAFADFHKAVLRGIASGLGVSYSSLSGDLEGTSYSSIRQGALEERDFYRLLQSWMIEHLIEPIFREWLSFHMEFGKTSNIGIDKFDKFMNAAHFRGRGFSWVDPKKEIEAAVIGLQNGLLSMQDVANNYGRDVEETFAQISRDKETAAQFGLSTAFEPFGAQKAQVPPEVEGEE